MKHETCDAVRCVYSIVKAPTDKKAIVPSLVNAALTLTPSDCRLWTVDCGLWTAQGVRSAGLSGPEPEGEGRKLADPDRVLQVSQWAPRALCSSPLLFPSLCLNLCLSLAISQSLSLSIYLSISASL